MGEGGVLPKTASKWRGWWVTGRLPHEMLSLRNEGTFTEPSRGSGYGMFISVTPVSGRPGAKAPKRWWGERGGGGAQLPPPSFFKMGSGKGPSPPRGDGGGEGWAPLSHATEVTCPGYTTWRWTPVVAQSQFYTL